MIRKWTALVLAEVVGCWGLLIAVMWLTIVPNGAPGSPSLLLYAVELASGIASLAAVLGGIVAYRRPVQGATVLLVAGLAEFLLVVSIVSLEGHSSYWPNALAWSLGLLIAPLLVYSGKGSRIPTGHEPTR